jgi:hypothetical protein
MLGTLVLSFTMTNIKIFSQHQHSACMAHLSTLVLIESAAGGADSSRGAAGLLLVLLADRRHCFL